jgi:hypothetical protein
MRSTAAQIVVHGFNNIRFGGLGLLAEQSQAPEDHARRAESTL